MFGKPRTSSLVFEEGGWRPEQNNFDSVLHGWTGILLADQCAKPSVVAVPPPLEDEEAQEKDVTPVDDEN